MPKHFHVDLVLLLKSFCDTIDEVVIFYRRFCEEFFGYLPYIFVQMRILNNWEYKIVILSNDIDNSIEEPIPVYCCQQGNKIRRTASDDELKTFAKKVGI